MCRVKVFSRSSTEAAIPTLFVTCRPSDDVAVGEPVNFRIWPQSGSVDAIQVDFGDGTRVNNYRPYTAIAHKFAEPGTRVVTVSGRAGGLLIEQKVKVRVRR